MRLHGIFGEGLLTPSLSSHYKTRAIKRESNYTLVYVLQNIGEGALAHLLLYCFHFHFRYVTLVRYIYI